VCGLDPATISDRFAITIVGRSVDDPSVLLPLRSLATIASADDWIRPGSGRHQQESKTPPPPLIRLSEATTSD
jgi:hypothetical protein